MVCGECRARESDAVDSSWRDLGSKKDLSEVCPAEALQRGADTPWLLLTLYGQSVPRGVFSRVDPSASLPSRAIPPADRSILESELMLCGVVERLHHADFHPCW